MVRDHRVARPRRPFVGLVVLVDGASVMKSEDSDIEYERGAEHKKLRRRLTMQRRTVVVSTCPFLKGVIFYVRAVQTWFLFTFWQWCLSTCRFFNVGGCRGWLFHPVTATREKEFSDITVLIADWLRRHPKG